MCTVRAAIFRASLFLAAFWTTRGACAEPVLPVEPPEPGDPGTPTEPAVPAERGSATPSAPSASLSPAYVPYHHRRWRLFDPFLSGHETVLFGGPSSFREGAATSSTSGGSLGVGFTQRDKRGPVWLSLQRDFELRVYSGWAFLLELSKYTYEAGLKLGPIEIGVGPGVTPVAVDLMDGDFSLSGLCPRATGRVGVKTGKFRASVRGYREYLWRWLGRDDAWITGFVIEVAVEAPRRTHWGGHPVVIHP
jgi:hypothetical protein